MLSRRRVAALLVLALIVAGVLWSRVLKEHTWFDALDMEGYTMRCIARSGLTGLAPIER
jgi:hypothetical protein